ncbi:dihydrodiol dehydrogenase [Streptomyces daliensis]|uniref:Dihydrodiol dehydrogenase n=1 Tax=Streptomyces daliensis TaxID=299421 RepID=A0A8T4IUJ6_9ACTN|nr:dihydrodiol dehydrogenase [Streptomyces daliensis]
MRAYEDGAAGEGADTDEGPAFQISNEFATIRLRKVHTRNGERVEIVAPRRGLRILLDAVELESLTWQTPETFSGFLRASIGRDGSGDESRMA